MIANGILSRLRRAGRRFRREEGNASVEFVVVFPILFYFLICAAETGYMLARAVMLDRSVDITVRGLRLGQYPGLTHDKLKELICENPALTKTGLMRNCDEVLKLELLPIDTATFTLPPESPTCVDRAAGINPPTTFDLGIKNQIMFVRACAVVDPIFPLTGVGFQMPKDASGGFQLVAMSAFVNEPR